jgi:ribosomal protein S27E
MSEIHKENLFKCPDCQSDGFIIESTFTVTCAVCGYSAGMLLPMGESKKAVANNNGAI